MAGFRIETIQAFVAVGPDGDEGIIGANVGHGWTPFVAADPERLEQLRPMARKIAKETGIEVRLIRFSLRDDLGAP
jgi:hypothetical protein